MKKWNSQEIECFKCKMSPYGCKACSIYSDYGIKTCYLFKYVLIKFSKIGLPREDLCNG